MHHGQRPAKSQQIGRSVQAGAALAASVSQQAFKHVTGIRVAGVMSAHVVLLSQKAAAD